MLYHTTLKQVSYQSAKILSGSRHWYWEWRFRHFQPKKCRHVRLQRLQCKYELLPFVLGRENGLNVPYFVQFCCHGSHVGRVSSLVTRMRSEHPGNMKNGGEQKSSTRGRPARFPYWYVTFIGETYIYTFSSMKLSGRSCTIAHESSLACVNQLDGHVLYVQCSFGGAKIL